MVSWDQHVPFGGLKWIPQDQNGSLKRPKMGFEKDVVGSFWVMWAFLLAQLLKNWSINFFEKVTLLNLCIGFFFVEGPALLLISEV